MELSRQNSGGELFVFWGHQKSRYEGGFEKNRKIISPIDRDTLLTITLLISSYRLKEPVVKFVLLTNNYCDTVLALMRLQVPIVT